MRFWQNTIWIGKLNRSWRKARMKDEEIKIIIREGKTITLKDLFEGKQKTRRKMANLPFEKKINMLISLQETARGWGRRKDVIIWMS